MPSVDYLEKRIKQVEGFGVVFLKNGADVRGDKTDLPPYRYSMAAKDSWTVAEWVANRFRMTYPGYDVRVIAHTGAAATGNMTLATVRGK